MPRYSPVNPVVGRLSNDVVIMSTLGELCLSQEQAKKLAADIAVILDTPNEVISLIDKALGNDIPPKEEIEKDLKELAADEKYAVLSSRLDNQMALINELCEKVIAHESVNINFSKRMNAIQCVMNQVLDSLKVFSHIGNIDNGKDKI